MRFKDEMTSKERMMAYFNNEDVDRPPFSLSLGEPAAKFINISSYDHYHNADRMVDVEEYCYNRFGQDGISIRAGLHGFAEAMGSKLYFPQYGLTLVEEPFLASNENHDKLSPADPHKDGRLPIFLEALEKLQERCGEVVGVSASIPGPFTTLSSLRGSENLMKDLYSRPDMVTKWLDIIMETFNLYIDEASKLNVGFLFAEPMGSCSLISPKMFKKFVQPYLSKCSDRIFNKTGKRPSLHICGQTEKILKELAEIKVSSLSLDNVVDMEKAKEEVGNEVCLVGNVKPVETIADGTKEDIFNEVEYLLSKLHDSPKGYIIAPGCQLPMTIDVEKIDMFVEAVHKFNKFNSKNKK